MHERGSLVWDLPSRLFHWTLLCCLAGSWITAEAGFEWTEWHFRLGYASLTLIAFRVIWGLVGTRHARFADFLRGPGPTLANAKRLFTRTPSNYAGHTPIGGWSVMLMLTLVAVQAGTGLFLTDDIFYAGPYNGVVSSATAGTLAQIHHLNFNLLQAVVVLHVAAVAWYRWGKGTHLVAPMLHGRKLDVDPAEAIDSSKLTRAFLVLVLAAGAVTALVQLAPPPSTDFYDF